MASRIISEMTMMVERTGHTDPENFVNAFEIFLDLFLKKPHCNYRGGNPLVEVSFQVRECDGQRDDRQG